MALIAAILITLSKVLMYLRRLLDMNNQIVDQ